MRLGKCSENNTWDVFWLTRKDNVLVSELIDGELSMSQGVVQSDQVLPTPEPCIEPPSKRAKLHVSSVDDDFATFMSAGHQAEASSSSGTSRVDASRALTKEFGSVLKDCCTTS